MSTREKRLRTIFSELTEADRHTLLAFAEFLHARALADNPARSAEPRLIPRPAQESVIGAIKRLSASYPMLDKTKLFHETSSLVSQHVLQGRDAVAVIDELEHVFLRHYQEHAGKP